MFKGRTSRREPGTLDHDGSTADEWCCTGTVIRGPIRAMGRPYKKAVDADPRTGRCPSPAPPPLALSPRVRWLRLPASYSHLANEDELLPPSPRPRRLLSRSPTNRSSESETENGRGAVVPRVLPSLSPRRPPPRGGAGHSHRPTAASRRLLAPPRPARRRHGWIRQGAPPPPPLFNHLPMWCLRLCAHVPASFFLCSSSSEATGSA